MGNPMRYRRRDNPLPKRKLPVGTGHSKREVWEEIKRLDSAGELPGTPDMIKVVSEEFGISAIEVKGGDAEMKWVKEEFPGSE